MVETLSLKNEIKSLARAEGESWEGRMGSELVNELVGYPELQALIAIGIKDFICKMRFFILQVVLLIGSCFIITDLDIHCEACAFCVLFEAMQVVFLGSEINGNPDPFEYINCVIVSDAKKTSSETGSICFYLFQYIGLYS